MQTELLANPDQRIYDEIVNALAHFQSFHYSSVVHPIYIPTRGRPTRQRTLGLLADIGLQPTLVVEPQDAEAYEKANPGVTLLVMEENDQGIAYVRNFILNDAYDTGREFCWTIDDDITKFIIRLGGKNLPASPRAYLSCMETVAGWFTNLGAIGGASAVWAYTHDGKPPVSFNNMVYGAALIRTTSHSPRYRHGTLEDHDFAQQLLTAGWSTILFRQLCFESPASGSVKGGNADTLFLNREAAVDKLIADWPGRYYKAFRKDGTPQAKPRGAMWSKFKQRPEWRS